ncbi:LacI family transcriptional regulator [Clostridia bacterium]|nr:LacI family transcriptional regulator [Clostridia bacterium]
MSLKQIASITGLSISTVSHAINGTRAVSAQNSAVVLAAAEKIGYRPNIAARMLKTQKSNTIALIIPNGENNLSANYFYMDALMGVRRKLMEAGYELIVSTYGMVSSGEKSISALQVLRNQWVDGVILVPSYKSDKQISVLVEELGLPFVLLDRRANNYECSCVDSDNEKGARDAVKLLASCGRTRIGYIGGGLATSTGRQRYNGYRSAITELGMNYDETLVKLHNSFSVTAGIQSAAELVDSGADALFAADNTVMLGAVQFLNRQGISIPDKVALVGYDDYEWMDMLNPPITTVRQQAGQMGYIAAEMILHKLNGIDANEKIVLETSLVLRKSHGTVRAQSADVSTLESVDEDIADLGLTG